MRLALAVQVALSIGVLSGTTFGFVPHSVPRTFGANTRVNVGSWENDDFLESLSGGPKEPSGQEPPAASDDSESSQGGSRLQQLMAQAKQAGSQPQTPAARPLTYKPPEYTPPNAAQAPPAAAPTQPAMPNLDNLTVEEQAEMFRRFMAGGQPLPEPVAAPAPSSAPVMRGGVDRQGRKIGRNKDADTIANSSDLYFAQLKADSTIRTLARYSGDDTTAENVMGHAAIQELADSMKINPYLEAQKEEERKMLETSEDELLSLIQIPERPQHEASYTGVSFREKMKQAKQKKSGAAAPASPAQSASAAAVEPKVEPTPVVAPPPPVAAVVPPPAPVIPPPAQAVVAASPPAPVVAAPQPVSSTTALADADAETQRRAFRTLMGLLLKHRGGPGFGSGRLKEPEALKLENLLGDVMGLLRTEIGMAPPAGATTVDVTAAPVSAPPAVSVPAPPAAPAGFDFDRLTGTIACIDGAIDMYKSSAAEEKSQNLLSLRAALMAAVNSVNQVIAEDELKSATASASSAAPAAPTGMDFPDTYAVTKPEESAAPTGMASPASGTINDNTAVLETIYEKLKAASGDGKLGLKSDLTSDEADVLVDELVSMRDLLMEELDSGISSASKAPPAKPQQAAPAEDAASSAGADTFLSNSSSKYAQMLAKSQAKKNAGQ